MSENLLDTVMETCPMVGYQNATVCVPITVTPFVHSGQSAVHCCGEPFVTVGSQTCSGVKNGSCHFTLSQTICVEVPISVGATTEVGDTYVSTGSVSTDSCGSGCDDYCSSCQLKRV